MTVRNSARLTRNTTEPPQLLHSVRLSSLIGRFAPNLAFPCSRSRRMKVWISSESSDPMCIENNTIRAGFRVSQSASDLLEADCHSLRPTDPNEWSVKLASVVAENGHSGRAGIWRCSMGMPVAVALAELEETSATLAFWGNTHRF